MSRVYNSNRIQMKKVEDAKSYMGKVKRAFENEPEKYDNFVSIMRDFKSNKIDTTEVTSRISVLFREHRTLLNEFNRFLPTDSRIRAQTGRNYQDAVEYVNRIKRYAPEKYDDFIKILKEYQNEQRSIDDVRDNVAFLLKDHQNLLAEFYQYLPDWGNENSNDQVFQSRAQLKADKRANKQRIAQRKGRVTADAENHYEHAQQVEVAEVTCASRGDNSVMDRIKRVLGLKAWTAIAKCVDLYTEGIISIKELCSLVEHMFDQNDELFEMFRSLMVTREANRRKYSWFCKPLSEIDFSDCKRVGSYTMLPKEYPKPICGGRTELCKSVLNDNWVSVPQGSEDYSFKHMRKNCYEEALFKCEDERYELDMVIQANLSTIKVLKNLQEKVNKMTPEELSTFAVDDNDFSIIHARAVSRIYGDRGKEIVKLFKFNPVKSISVILGRLQSKADEWADARVENLKQWRDICEKNFHKSLDHRSFYFKQNEKKVTNPKYFLNEAKKRYTVLDLSDPGITVGGCKGTNFFDSFQGLGTGIDHHSKFDDAEELLKLKNEFPNLQLPHFRFLFNHKEIHDDAIRLIFFYISRTYSSNNDKQDKVKETFKAIMSEFLGFDITEEIENFDAEEYITDEEDEDENLDEEGSDKDSDQENTTTGNGKKNSKPTKEEKKPKSEKRNDDVDSQDSNQSVFDEEPTTYKAMTVIQDEEEFEKSMFLPIYNKKFKLFFGSTQFYSFLRFYYSVYERLIKIKQTLRAWHQELMVAKDTNSEELKAVRVLFQDRIEEAAEYDEESYVVNQYKKYLKTLYSLINGNIDPNKYEDSIRILLDNKAYVMFTFEKLLNMTTKALLNLNNEDFNNKVLDLYRYQLKHPANFSENIYWSNYNKMTMEKNQNSQSFRFLWDPDHMILCIHFFESPYGRNDRKMIEAFNVYTENYAKNCSKHDGDKLARSKSSQLFLRRNVRPKAAAKRMVLINRQRFTLFNPQDGSSRIMYVPHTEDCYFLKPDFRKNKNSLESVLKDLEKAQKTREWTDQFLKMEK